MSDELILITANTDDTSSTVEDYDGELCNQIRPGGFKNQRTISTERDSLAGPIATVVVAEALTDGPTPIGPERYQKRKPIFVKANLNKTHIKPGEGTSKATDLRDTIRNRGHVKGSSPDDCGHIIGYALNGHMVDYNLFPQQMHVNRGIFGNYFFWRAIEAAMKFYLRLVPNIFSPRVEFNMLLSYEESNKPDRPNKFKYCVGFYAKLRPNRNVDAEDNHGETTVLKASKEILNIAKQAIKKQSRRTMRQQILDVIRRFDLQHHLETEILAFADELEDIFGALESPNLGPDHLLRDVTKLRLTK